MFGAIIGDIAGSRFEFNNTSDYDFELFSSECSYTDDTICTVAIASAILGNKEYKYDIPYWCGLYPNPMGAYGGLFSRWLASKSQEPYYSYGNGAAMRVSPVAWAFDSEADVIRQAIRTAEFTHNHPEGLIGAVSVALGIYKMRKDKAAYRSVIEATMNMFYGSDWENRLPPRFTFDGTCQGCVPLAFHLLKQSDDFEDAIRKAVTYGGDSDTLGAITGSLAEAVFPIDEKIKQKALDFLPQDMREVVNKFSEKYL